MFSVLKAFTESITDIIYPPICVGCGHLNHTKANRGYLCSDCYYGIKKHIPPFCHKCGRGLIEKKNIQKGHCSNCLKKLFYFDHAWSVCSYEGIIKELIHKFKYGQKIHYEIIFRNLINEFLQIFNILKDIDLIIPIPLHPTKLREREYNQSQILANIISQAIEKPVVLDILFRIRNTKPQIDLDENSRIKNIRGCFIVDNGDMIESKSVLLIDDVLTTGITLSEAARMLKQFNPFNISVLALSS